VSCIIFTVENCTEASVGICSEESERVSELKNVSGSGKLPYGTLALGAEGIKEAITSFEDAYVPYVSQSK
jgi:hypothetical protein